MPGHKRNIQLLGNDLPYDIDVTEIDGFDNLQNPDSIIKNLEDRLKSIYKVQHSHILVNGSTCGILAGVNSVVKQGDKVLLSRNCHKSVYNAIEIAKAKPVYLNSEFDNYGIAKSINLKHLEKALDDNIKLVVITSPTYEGVISNVKEICYVAHKRNIPVLVDSAHGAHLFDGVDADITIMSLHKTLPALTQCAVAHINSDIVDNDKFKNYLNIFQTSSPSYVLMSSIEKCVDFIEYNNRLFSIHKSKVNKLCSELSKLKHLKLLQYDDFSKIIIFTGNSNISGTKLAEILRNNFNMEVEMALNHYILAMTSVCDEFEYYSTFADALLKIDSQLNCKTQDVNVKNFIPEKYCQPYEVDKTNQLTPVIDSIGKVSCEYVWAYPPGVPLLVPGEIITKEVLEIFNEYYKNNTEIHSTYNNLPENIMCKSI